MTSQLELFAFSDLNVTPGQSDTIERDGFTLRATIYADEDAEAPWDAEDGHGPVTGWCKREAGPGERVLVENSGSRRFYRFSEALRFAKNDQWGVEGGQDEGESLDEYAHRAALADFERLRGWANDEWSYVGVSVTVSKDDVILTGQHEHATWSVESDCPDFVSGVANDLIDEALEAARAKLQALAPVTQVGTIDLGVTWASVAQMVALGLENGTDEGKRLARVELDRMAKTLTAVGPTLQRAEAFVSGFEDDDAQEGVPALLADLRDILAGRPTVAGSVLDRFKIVFPLFEIADDDDREAMADMPLDSNCGDDCRQAIDAAQALAGHVRAAYGDHRPDLLDAAAGTAVEVCNVYIRG